MSGWVPCPLCGGDLAMPQRRAGTRWTLAEIHQARRLKGLGLSHGAIGRLMGGVAARAVQAALVRKCRPVRERAA